MRPTEIYCCSTLLSLATALAWRGPADDASSRRVLLACDYAPEAEAGTPLLQRDGAAALAAGFDLVVDVNQLLAPYHPASFDPGRDAAALLGRLLCEQWGVTGDVSLVVEPIQVGFARWLLQVMPDAPVTVVADGLMAYGPSRDRVPASIGRRITRLVHLDLVQGLRPVYLTEHDVPACAVPPERLREVLDVALCPATGAPDPVAAPAMPRQARRAIGGDGVLVLGQYLSELGVLSVADEQALYLEAVVGAASLGPSGATSVALDGAPEGDRGGAEVDGRHDAGVPRDAGAGLPRVAFKPHPAAAPLRAVDLRRAAAAKGVDLQLLPASGPAEALFASGRYGVVAGCFSTGLFTGSRVYGLRAVSVGTELLLEWLRPYQNSNRIPVTLADALLRPEAEVAAGEQVGPEEIGELVRAVAYCMQPDRYPGLREAARVTVERRPGWRARYVKRKRLHALGLTDMASTRSVRSALRRRTGQALRALRGAARRTARRAAASS